MFMRVHRTNQRDGALNPGAFRDHGIDRPGMSTAWCKYGSAKRTQQDAKHPEDNGVVRMRVGEVREIEGLTVEHVPLWPSNRAHTEVFGEKTDEEVRVKLRRACSWEISVPPKT
jgi:hypothetical protein